MSQPVDGVQSDADTAVSGSESGTGTSNADATAGAQSGTETQTDATVSRADYEAIQRRMQAADKRAADNEAALRQLRDKDLPEAEKLKRDYEEITKRAEVQDGVIKALRIENAFLTDNTYAWRDPKAAMKLVDMSEVTIDSDGHVLGLKEALKKLATSSSWMLAEETPNGEQNASRTGGAAGAPPMNGKPGSEGANKDGLRKRFKALGGRV